MVQLVSAYAALGQFDEALSLASELSAFADEVGHGARGVDVAVARVAVERRGKFGPISRELLDEGVRLMNSPALLKLGLTEERRTTAVQDDAGSDAAGDLLRTHLRSLQPERLGLFAGVDAYQAVLTAPDTSVSVPPPEAPTLLSLPNVLASAEAVAIGGTVCGAADWLAWLEAELPANVVTSLEWPACRRRIEALLWLRMGHREVALECLRQSIELCGGRGDSIEAEIGRAQLAALVGDEDEAALAASRLLEVGIDASLFAEVATRVAARAALVEPALTVPEARVIGRVANGMSQREIEAELGLPSRGASRVTATGYPKLGVKGRAQVAQVARELQIV